MAEGERVVLDAGHYPGSWAYVTFQALVNWLQKQRCKLAFAVGTLTAKLLRDGLPTPQAAPVPITRYWPIW